MNNKHLALVAIAAASALVAVPDASAQSVNYWTAQGTSLNWSDNGNWALGAPPVSLDTLWFDDLNYAGYTNTAGAVNNVVNGSFSVGTLNWTALAVSGSGSVAGSHYYTTLIPAGMSLNLAGSFVPTTPTLRVGTDLPTLANATVVATVTGPGSLLAPNNQATLSIAETANGSGTHRATFDLSGLNMFTATASNLWVGVSSAYDKANGVLLLAKTNTISTGANPNAPGILLGRGMTNNGFGNVTLGAVNTINTDGLVVGGARSSFGANTLNFYTPPFGVAPSASLKMRGSAGGSVRTAVFAIGDSSATETNYSAIANGNAPASGTIADFTAGTVDILATNLFVARSAADDPNLASGSSAGTANGNLVFSTGTIDALSAVIGYKQGTNRSAAVGTVTARGNAVLTVSNELTLAHVTNTVTGVTATLNVNDAATVNVGGNLLTRGGTAGINLAGGTIKMTGGGVLAANTLAGYGTITNASNLILSNSITMGIATATALVPGTLTIGSNLTLNGTTPSRFKLGANLTPGNGINDYLDVTGNLAGINTNLTPVFVGMPQVGAYNLIRYSGTKSINFNLALTNTTRYMTFALNQAAPPFVSLNVSQSQPPALLTWKGGSTGTWDLTNNVSWNNNTEKFYTFDGVLFDDTGAFSIIQVPGTVQPGNMTFNNSSKLYTLYAPGKITGPAGLTKNGSGTVILATLGTSDYAGPVNVNQGTLQIQSTSGTTLFGVTNKLITIASGASLDVYGNTVGSGSGIGWPITFSGSGVGGIGAIAHTKTSSGPTLFTPKATLAGDASIGVTTAGINLFVAGVTTLPLGGVLDLTGQTLTTTGLGNVGFVNLLITNSGNIQVNSANLTLRDVILDGPGVLTAGSKNIVLGNLGGTAWTTGYVAKAISIGPGTLSAPGSSSLVIPVSSPVTLTGNLTVNNTQPIRMAGVISGGFGLTKLGSTNLILAAANSYTGPTIVSGGTLVLDTTGAIANSPLLRIDSAAALNLTAKGGSFALAPGQTLQVDGAEIGNFTVPSGATLAGSGGCTGAVAVVGGILTPGLLDLPRTLTVGSLSLSNASLTMELDNPTTQGGNVNDLIAVSGALNFAGTNVIKIVPIGFLSAGGAQYTLFTYGGPALPSSITNNIVLTSDTRYTISIVDPATTPGYINIAVQGSPQPLSWRGGVPSAPTAWDINTTPNWDKNFLPEVFFNGDAVNFDDGAVTHNVTLVGALRPSSVTLLNNLDYFYGGAGSLRAGTINKTGNGGLIIANSADNFLPGSGLFLYGGTVTFNQPTNTTFTGTLTSSGSGALAKEGPYRLTLTGNSGPSFFSPINVNAGTLQAGSSNALGQGTVTVATGATLDLNGQVVDAPTVAVSGAGIGGQGAINNTGGAQTNALSRVALNGNTTFGAQNRWDIKPGTYSSLQGNNYKLTKTGPADVWVDTLSDTGLGDIDIQQGRLVFGYFGTDLGNPANTMTVRSNASLVFAYDIVAGAKPVNVLTGGDIEAFANTSVSPVIGASNSYAGNVTFSSTGLVRLATLSGLTLSGTIKGPSGLVNADVGWLTLSGSNAYNGDLTIPRGPVAVTSSNALPPNTTVTMNGDTENQSVFFYLGGDAVTDPSVPLNMYCYRTPSGPRTPTFSGQGIWRGPINMIGVQVDPSQDPQVSFEGSTNLVIAQPVLQSGSPRLNMNINGFPGTVRFAAPLQYNGTMRMGSQGLGIDADLTQKYTTMQLDSSNNAFTNMLFWRGKIIIGADNAIPTNCPITTSFVVTDNDHRGIIDLSGHAQTFVNFPGLAPSGGFPAMPIWIGNDSTNADAKVVFNSTLTNSWCVWIVDNLAPTNTPTSKRTGLSVLSGYLRLAPWTWGNWFHSSGIIAQTNNAYTGPTLVSGGFLQVDTMITNTPVTVSGTGTLAGSGLIYGPITIGSGATLSPGGTAAGVSAIGRMTNYNNLTLQSGSKCYLEVNLTSQTNDMVVGISNLVYGGTLTITNVGAQPFTNGTVVRLFAASNYTAGAVTILPASPAPGLLWDTTQLAVDGTIRVFGTPGMSNPTRTSDGNFRFTLTGSIGQPYSVRASTNLLLPRATWPVLQTGVMPGATTNYTDLTATNYPSRYYLLSNP